MPFKINYKGTSCRGTKFLYRCGKCKHEQEAVHPAREEPRVGCTKCHSTMNKKPVAPAFDADHHDSMKSWNLGWYGDETE